MNLGYSQQFWFNYSGVFQHSQKKNDAVEGLYCNLTENSNLASYLIMILILEESHHINIYFLRLYWIWTMNILLWYPVHWDRDLDTVPLIQFCLYDNRLDNNIDLSFFCFHIIGFFDSWYSPFQIHLLNISSFDNF